MSEMIFLLQDPLILSSLLSCISALFIFLKYTPEILSEILQKVRQKSSRVFFYNVFFIVY